MRKKILYITVSIFSMFVGVIATILVIKYIPDNETPKEIKNVSITENNTIKSAIQKVYNAVLLIETYRGNQKISTGTGFIYKKEKDLGYIITNYHVIENATTIKVVNMNEKTIEAKILGSDEYSDLAILSVPSDSVLQIASLGSSSSLELGDTLFTIGSPLGSSYKGTVTKGILSGKDRIVTVSMSNGSYMMEVLQTDAAINPGNSGGPLVNINGEVIGVNSLKLVEDQIEGMGFAIPIDLVKVYIDRLEKGEEIKRPLLGIEFSDATDKYLLFQSKISIDEKLKNGVVVIDTEEGYPAFKAGLKTGDVIIEVNGTKINNSAHFKYLLYKYNVGDKIKIKYNRNGKEIETELNLDKGL